MMKCFNLLFVFLFTTFISAFSQTSDENEYFTLKSGAVIQGKIIRKYDDNQYPTYEFKSKEGKLYAENEVQSFKDQSGDLYFNSISEEGFARQVLTGKLDLYYYNDTFIVKDGNGNLYILNQKKDSVKSGDKIFLRKTNSWIGVLSFLTSDCEKIDVSKLTFNEKYIINYLKDYHKCIDHPYKINNEITPWIKTQFGVFFGRSNNTATITQQSSTFRYYPESLNSQNYLGGIDIYLSVPRKSMKLSYSTGLQFQQNIFTSEFTTNVPEEIRYYSEISYSMLTLPIMIHYNLNINKFTLMLSAGPHVNSILSQDIFLIEQRVNSNTERPLDENFKLSLNSINFGLNGKVSVSRSFNNIKLGLFASFVRIGKFGSGSYNNSQPYEASNQMLQVGIQLIR